MHSDAFITDDDEFRRTLAAAIEAAAAGDHLVTTGIEPRFAATGYGYIQRGEELGQVRGFPSAGWCGSSRSQNLETAQAYVSSGEYLWNPGVFVWKNSTLIDAFREHQPAIYDTLTSVPLDQDRSGLPECAARDDRRGDHGAGPQRCHDPSPLRLERHRQLGRALGAFAARCRRQRRPGRGRVITADSTGNMVFAERRTVSLVGVDDLIVVETDDAIFVCPRDRAQDVKLIVQRLQAEGAADLL